jgi:transmembrane sensor
MMSSGSQATTHEIKISEMTIDQAIDWTIKLNFNTPNKAAKKAFNAWLVQSPEHQIAWQRVNEAQADFTHLSNNVCSTSSNKTAKNLALNTLQRADQQRAGSGLTRRQSLKLLSICVVGISSALVIKEQTPWQRMLADVSTKLGEQRSLTLDDGTELILNTDSAVSIEFSDNQRLIVLRRGEIFINTGKDIDAISKRPLIVQTSFGNIQPIGTRFVVRLNDHNANVTVQQGAVKLLPIAGDMHTTAVVEAGESWLLSKQHSHLAPANVISPTAWLDGSIAGNNIPLHLLLTELARYRVGIIRCDNNIKNLLVSGVYHLADTDKTLRFLQQSQGLTIRFFSRFVVMVSLSKH